MFLNVGTNYIIALCIIIAVILVLAIVTIIILKKKNKGHVKVDNEFIENIISYLGGKENISGVGVDNARLKVSVKDLSIVKSNELGSICEKGVFITGNNIKMMFKYDSQTIKNELEKSI